jgi:hypothetical protein
MKQFKIIAGFILLVQISTSFQTMARERYRIVVKQIEGKVKYIPQTKKHVTGFLAKQWVDLANQPLGAENEARNYVLEAQIVDKQIQQSTIQNFIYIK